MKNYKYYDNLLFVDGIYMFRKNGQWQAYGVENNLTVDEIREKQANFMYLIHIVFYNLELKYDLK